MDRTLTRFLNRDEGITDKEVRESTLFDWVSLDKLFVAKYGRPISSNKVAKLVKNWRTERVGMIYLSMRTDGKFAVLDGAHRIAAAMEKGIEDLPARIYIDLSYEQEADLYVAFATVNKQTALDRFRARLESRDPDAMIVQGICERIGIPVATERNQENAITAVMAIDGLYEHYGADFLREVVQILFDAYGFNHRAWTREVLVGLSMFWVRFRSVPGFSRSRLVDKLAESGVNDVIAKGVQIAGALSETGHTGFGRAIWGIYNKHLTDVNRLPEWQTVVYSEKGRMTMNQSRGRRAQNKAVPTEPDTVTA